MTSSPTLADPDAAAADPGARPRLGELLVARGQLSPRDLERALAAQLELGELLGRVLVRLGLVAELDVARALAEQLGVPLVLAESYPALPPELPGLRPDFQREAQCLPLAVEDGRLRVAMVRPDDAYALKALALTTGLRPEPCLALESELDKALREPAEPQPLDEADSEADGGEFIEQLRDLASEAPVIRLAGQILGRVIELRASDIHLEPFDDGLHVRYRVDGEIATHQVLPPRQGAAVTSRMKLMAHLDIAERRLPQDGRIRTRLKGHDIDLRVSTVPTVHGESMVMRVLDRSSVRLELGAMGFTAEHLAQFQDLLRRPHGILLVTGPTGSGKTTTLYAGLAKIDADAHKIITVEEPVEYQLPGINQIQVHGQIGLSFARALRSILRQDPDIIMIGEMRDGETAQIAVQAALTGHLVLSTLHTNTAAGAVVRLQDMGVERYLITSSLNGVLSQRLVRRLCPACRRPVEPPPELLRRSGLARWLPAGRPVYEPVGCASCLGSGYRGRTGVHELLQLDDRLRRGILDGWDAATLHREACAGGMLSLHESGLRQVAEGVTTLDEVLRVTEDQSDA